MSALTDLIYAGSNAVAGLTEGAVNDAIAKHGADTPVAFPDTAYFFPTIYAATGVKVKTLGDLPACVDVLKSLITNQDDIAQALNAGLATAVGAEIIEGLKYLGGADPYAEDSGIGFVPDPIIRSLGVPLVTGDIPGVAVVLGKADNAADVAAVVKDYQSKGILTFMIGDCIEQALAQGVKMGLELRVVPLGHDVTSVIHVVTVAIRAALIFGNVQAGDLGALLTYTKDRVPAFVNTFGPLNEVVVSAGAGAIAQDHAPVTRSDVEAKLSSAYPIAQTTLLTLLSRLGEKGFVRVEKSGRNRLYIPLVSRADYLAAQSSRFFRKLCGGNVSAFASALCASDLTEEELAQLRELLERREL